MTTPAADTPTSSPRALPGRVLIVIPVFEDWDAVGMLLQRLDVVLAAERLPLDVLLVDDGSTTVPPVHVRALAFRAIRRVDVLTLRRNMGHQRAIAIALAHAYEHLRPDAVLLMDGDGEDAPEDVPILLARLAALDGRTVVFAERTRRSESLAFKVFYALYRGVHRLLTGIPVRVGNFSAIPAGALSRLVVVSELWNHYAAGVFKSRLNRVGVPCRRASRLHGQSKMNFVSLVGHGLSALSVHAEVIGARLFVATAAVIALTSILLVTAIAIRFSTDLAIPGWATAAVGLLAVLLLQAIGLAIFFVFIILHGRSQALFVPLRDYAVFVDGVRPLSAEPR